MKKTVAAIGFAAVIGFAFCQSAQAQYSEHRVGKAKIVKCYREFRHRQIRLPHLYALVIGSQASRKSGIETSDLS